MRTNPYERAHRLEKVQAMAVEILRLIKPTPGMSDIIASLDYDFFVNVATSAGVNPPGKNGKTIAALIEFLRTMEVSQQEEEVRLSVLADNLHDQCGLGILKHERASEAVPATHGSAL